MLQPWFKMNGGLALFMSFIITTYCEAGQRPNIVLIVADDLGWNDVGFHGSEIRTPHLDTLAYNGVILNNYYVSPICTPTRGALMTGRHPIHLGLQHYVISAPEPWGLPLNFTTMGEHFKQLGYNTHIVGKWHLGFFNEAYLPTNRGFDSHFGYWTGKEDYYDHMDIDGYKGLDFRYNMDIVNATVYSTEIYTKAAVQIIQDQDNSTPLFLYLAHQAVHAGNANDPIQAPQKYIDRFAYIKNIRRRKFAGVVSALDDSVGQVVDALQEAGMMENTIIVFSTDNGGPANNYDLNAACNFPLRGTKNTMWEGGVHGVGFISSPLLQVQGTKSNNMIHVSDWLPTLYGAAGGNVTNLGQIDGLNLWEMLKSGGDNVRSEILHNIDPVSSFSAIRVEDYKLVMGDISNHRDDKWYPCNPPVLNETELLDYYPDLLVHTDRSHSIHDRSVLSDPYRINCGARPENYTTNCQPEKFPCLFHIPSDPCEYNNIADTNIPIVSRLLLRLQSYAETAVKPVNKPADKRANPANFGGVWTPWT